MVGLLGPPRATMRGTATPTGCDLLEPLSGAWVLCFDLDIAHTPYDVFWIGLRWTKKDRPTDQVLFLTPGGTLTRRPARRILPTQGQSVKRHTPPAAMAGGRLIAPLERAHRPEILAPT